jgi:hypothetical protein
MTVENKQPFEQEQAMDAEAAPASAPLHDVEVQRTMADSIRTTQSVTIRQGGAKEIRAQDVSIRQGIAGSVDADSVEMVQVGVGLVRAGDAHLGPGASAAAVLADSVRLEQSGAQFILARDSLEMDQSAAGVLVGQHVTVRDSSAMLLFADKVEGDVNVIMDRQMAITFGAALGAALGLMLGLFGILRRKK